MRYAPLAEETGKRWEKARQDAIERFDEAGESGPHSQMGQLLAAICNHCVQRGISFKLRFFAGGGYYIEKWDGK